MEWISLQNEEVEIFMSCGVSPRWHGGGYFPKVLCFKSWIWLTRRYWALVLGWGERLFTLDQSQLRARAVSTNQDPWQSREPWYKPCDMEYNNIITSLLIPLLPLKHRMERQQEEMSSISKVWTIIHCTPYFHTLDQLYYLYLLLLRTDRRSLLKLRVNHTNYIRVKFII